MLYLQEIGEWPIALIGLALVFLVAALGATGLGWWVMRGDALNRRIQHLDSGDQASGPEEAH